ncbi:MAG: aminodeoxychorismate/anthranilate synthase component II [Bacteroidales bacterium]|jgi:anthranilate synthase component II|nr:aminodeoxychorismate/anthranilate synthase component II [Lentimicrobiaceae bacterium]MDG1136059.1 aminodeoxychorismate/anthranilate synthase component II [Bacteroidales bacterium]MDG1902003.1 aminodeoxychorismate/anthranilate synthase component II [Bacteroidales bacterium]MDG2080382.1 aminodeoxychorismate/anthranilate synthase component II [Bacteroidales bacterium]|tara:strand:+ start:678 stop:1238 length:561 start_codon:yes stop_codon:yes gene_type:complete
MKLLIIDNYDSFTHNLVQLVERAGVFDYLVVKNDELNKISPNMFDKVLISPGPGVVKDAGDLLWFLKKFYAAKPILGICLGNEAIGELFGGKLIQMSTPMHGIKNLANILIRDDIFNGIPDNFFIGHYHSWNIEEISMPDTLEIILRDENGLNMAIRHVELPIIGLQFHPESIMTEYGINIMKNWL